MVATFLVVALALAKSADVTEADARKLVLSRFEKVGRSTPQSDTALDKAAWALANLALETSATKSAELLAVTQAVSRAGASDPSPKMFVVKARPAKEALEALRRRVDLANESMTHLGIGAATKGEDTALVVLLSQRRATLRPFPRQLPAKPSPQRLCAEMAPGLVEPEVFVTEPGGNVKRYGLKALADMPACGTLTLSLEGRYTVEVLARGERGPVVSALFFVTVGSGSDDVADAPVEPTDSYVAKVRITDRINALRQSAGLEPLIGDDDLDSIAVAYAEKLSKQRDIGHADTDGTTLVGRLKKAGYVFGLAGENLALASGPLAAHFGIEHSPGHRNNLLDAKYQRIGIGLAMRADRSTVLVEIVAAPPEELSDPRATVKEIIADARAKAGLRRLDADPTLDQVADDHARLALEKDLPKSEIDGVKVHDKVFEVVPAADRASADVVVVRDLRRLPAPKNALGAGLQRVGVGVVQGDSPRLGNDLYWVVVVYVEFKEGP